MKQTWSLNCCWHKKNYSALSVPGMKSAKPVIHTYSCSWHSSILHSYVWDSFSGAHTYALILVTLFLKRSYFCTQYLWHSFSGAHTFALILVILFLRRSYLCTRTCDTLSQALTLCIMLVILFLIRLNVLLNHRNPLLFDQPLCPGKKCMHGKYHPSISA